MLRLLLVCIVLACNSSKPATAPATFELHVDRRVELMALLQRLVGAKEYLATPATAYVAAVDAHFAAFKNHPAVAATRELRQNPGIGFDGPMWLAVELDDTLQLRNRPGDARWANVDIEAYLAKIRDFVNASGFDAFLAQHRTYFTKIEDRLRAAITTENPRSWFDGFFGARPGATFVVVPALLVGTHNFGPHTASELYQIIGVVRVDFDELPTFDPLTLELVVHEMAHSYINPLFDKHAAALEPHGTRLFAQVAETMRKQAYPTWNIMLNEQGVRAVTSLYMRERKSAREGELAVAQQESLGFKWTKGLVDKLAEYRAQRQQFSDLDAFMPTIVAFFAAQ